VNQLQSVLDTAKLQHPASVVAAFTKELAAAKAEEAKLSNSTPTQSAKDALRTQLQNRVEKADAAAAGAAGRHLLQLAALGSQGVRLQEIRAHKVLDFAQCRQAFVERLVEDKAHLKEFLDVLGQILSPGDGAATSAAGDTVAAMAVDHLGNHVDTDPALAFLCCCVCIGSVLSFACDHVREPRSDAADHPHAGRGKSVGRTLGGNFRTKSQRHNMCLGQCTTFCAMLSIRDLRSSIQ
jgi:hypothetical protein